MDIYNFLAIIIKYVFPIVALFLAILSYKDSRGVNDIQIRVNKLEESLLLYELEDVENKRKQANNAKIEARITKISTNNYIMKIWNSGQATAFKVDFVIPVEYKGMVFRDKVPFEFLESGKYFEEHVIYVNGKPSKFLVTTMWEDNKGEFFKNEQMVTI